ncbi:tail fiber assembly protein [Paenirhodobacter populi]|uniref:Phage tail assembly chaperone-like domain-containing protein n=1 Tax=Paenirhodobacter populi TaxID=2306993 RepID=A0A443IQF6_9RHOB|nr:tail fiber assembly protein [Sinirhodobacter populi]RWR08533.1 hypothetical protein D2T33_15670 [Sinirhodobacter populi]
MIRASIYDANGAIIAVGLYPNAETLALNVPAGGGWIEGHVNPNSVYVADGNVVVRPDRPTACHVWDWSALTWVEDAGATASVWSALRAERDRRLDASDKYTAPDYPQTDEQRIARLAYRQDLRDLPENTVDPCNPDWPELPSQ